MSKREKNLTYWQSTALMPKPKPAKWLLSISWLLTLEMWPNPKITPPIQGPIISLCSMMIDFMYLGVNCCQRSKRNNFCGRLTPKKGTGLLWKWNWTHKMGFSKSIRQSFMTLERSLFSRKENFTFCKFISARFLNLRFQETWKTLSKTIKSKEWSISKNASICIRKILF